MSSFQLCSKISDKDFLESTFETKDVIDGSDVIPYENSIVAEAADIVPAHNEVEVYVSRHDFKLNLDMLNYGVEDKGYKMDWSKLSYGDEQMAEHLLNKVEERMPPHHYNYLFRKPHKRTIQEKFYLKEAGICFDELEDMDDNDDEHEHRFIPACIARY